MRSVRDERGYAAQLRATGSLVHNITNYVVMNNTANALLAAGASPAMVHAVDEVEEFVAISQALVVNIGTLSPAWAEAMRLAAGRARRGYPVSARPGGRGRDALPHGGRRRVGTARPDRRPGQRVLRSWRSRGPWARSATATLMMARVTGLGCTASALVGAALAVAAGDPFGATVAALAALGVAGEMAVEGAAGPGSLHFRLIDALYTLDEEMLRRRVQVELVA